MSIVEYVAITSFVTGIATFLTVILPIALTLFTTLVLIDRARAIAYRGAVDYLEITERYYSLRNDRDKRELNIVEAGIALRARRLELRSKQLELLGSIDDTGT